jgi:uncharacterized protein YbjQ (UPF0145 family)
MKTNKVYVLFVSIIILIGIGCANVRLDSAGLNRYMNMKVYMPGDTPQKQYREIGSIKERSIALGVSLIAQGPESAIEEAKKRTASVGGNALIITNITNVGFTMKSGANTYECIGKAVFIED